MFLLPGCIDGSKAEGLLARVMGFGETEDPHIVIETKSRSVLLKEKRAELGKSPFVSVNKEAEVENEINSLERKKISLETKFKNHNLFVSNQIKLLKYSGADPSEFKKVISDQDGVKDLYLSELNAVELRLATLQNNKLKFNSVKVTTPMVNSPRVFADSPIPQISV